MEFGSKVVTDWLKDNREALIEEASYRKMTPGELVVEMLTDAFEAYRNGRNQPEIKDSP